MKKLILLCAALLCLAACGPTEPPVRFAVVTPVTPPVAISAPTGPALRVAQELEAGVVEVVAGDAILRDMRQEFGPDGATLAWVEGGIRFYFPELLPGQAVRLSPGGEGCYRIAYTNSAGVYEAQLLRFDDTHTSAALERVEPDLRAIALDENFGYLQPDDFAAEAKTGAFDAYIPQGLCIGTGSLGDVNADGIRDALLGLVSAGRHARVYMPDIPLFVLLGQPEGGYAIAARYTGVLFLTDRGPCQPIAGEGAIELRAEYSHSAWAHETEIVRFAYDAEAQDWLLSEITFYPDHLPEGDSVALSPALVRPVSALEGQSLSAYTYDSFRYAALAEEDFDLVETYTTSDSYGSYDYSLCLRRDEAAGAYEGHIYLYSHAYGGGNFAQTLRGELVPGEAWDVVADAEAQTFAVQGDVWQYDEPARAFFLELLAKI